MLESEIFYNRVYSSSMIHVQAKEGIIPVDHSRELLGWADYHR